MGHWYKTDGQPLYEINKVGSKEKRDTNLADARKFNLVPSVTTVSSILAKSSALDTWKINQFLLALREEGYCKPEESWEAFTFRLNKATKVKLESAAKRGTEIHDKLENYFKTGKIDETDSPFLVPALNLLSYEFNGQKWVSEASFAHKEGFGGKIDLHSKTIVLDFKTKSKDILDKKCLYNDYCMQLAAYRLGLDLPNAECYNLIISTTSPGTLYLHKWPEEELKAGLELFRDLLSVWKKVNKFDSSFGAAV